MVPPHPGEKIDGYYSTEEAWERVACPVLPRDSRLPSSNMAERQFHFGEEYTVFLQDIWLTWRIWEFMSASQSWPFLWEAFKTLPKACMMRRNSTSSSHGSQHQAKRRGLPEFGARLVTPSSLVMEDGICSLLIPCRDPSLQQKATDSSFEVAIPFIAPASAQYICLHSWSNVDTQENSLLSLFHFQQKNESAF